MISLTCGEIIFLAMSIFRRVTFGSGLLVIPNTFGDFLFFTVGLLFLAITIYNRGGHLQGDKWWIQISKNGSMRM
jgi:hypothetical protein